MRIIFTAAAFLFLFPHNPCYAQWEAVVPNHTSKDIIVLKAFSNTEYLMTAVPKAYPGFEVLSTIDSAETWKSVYIDTSRYISAGFFLDTHSGWLISNDPSQVLLKTTAGGSEWKSYRLPSSDSAYFKVIFANVNLGYILSRDKIIKSTDGGLTWSLFYRDSLGGLTDLSVVSENFIAAAGGNLKITRNGGVSWEILNTGSHLLNGVHFIDTLRGFAMSDSVKVIKTTDGGKYWTYIIDMPWEYQKFVTSDFKNNLGVITYTSQGHQSLSFFTSDGGENWNTGYPWLTVKSSGIIDQSSYLIGGLNGVLIRCSGYGDLEYLGNSNLNGIGRGYFSREGHGYFLQHYLDNTRILHTSNYGKTFSKITLPYVNTGYDYQDLAPLGDSILILRGEWKVYRSSNQGTDWQQVVTTPPIPINYFGRFSFIDSTTGYFSILSGIYKTTNAGVNWNRAAQIQSREIDFVNEQTGFMTSYDSIYKTSDGGVTWQPQKAIQSAGDISMIDEYVGAAVSWLDEIFYTHDGGENWNASYIDSSGIKFYTESFRPSEIEVFHNKGRLIAYAVMELDFGNILFYSIDSCKTFHMDKSFPDYPQFLTAFEGTLWVSGGYDGGAFILKRENFDELPVLTSSPQYNITVTDFQLHHNYPNPFNPVTTISFSLPHTGIVSLKVYDILGRETAVLLNEYRTAGRYKVQFNGSELASGVYFYRLQSGDYSETKKMMLTK